MIDIRTDSPTGTSIGKLTVKGTGSWTTFVSQTATLNQKISGLKDIYFVGQGTFGVANVQSFKFNKVVATAPAPPPASVGSSPVITFVTVPVSGTSQTVSQISFNVVTSSINRQIQCSLNSAAFTNCISPVAVMSPVGTRSFSVKVTDLGNNLSTTISYSWTVISPSLDDFMPYVNLSLAAPPEIGSSLLLVQSTSEQPSVGFGGGQFRISCRFSHMANNDPIVYPGKTGASHHHTFFGNTGTNAFSTNFSLTTSGNSTCAGGIMNRSAYWVPSMIDTTTGKPIRPLSNLVYYKTDNPALVTVPPVGLRMIANGSSNTTGPSSQYARKNRYTCTGDNTWGESIGPCANGSTIHWMMSFPDCWDGKNLDSPDHKSHMAFQSNGNCPATHPVLIPEITYNVHYPVTNGTANWRLASDHYSTTLPGGYSGHGDWMNGWDQKFLEGFINNCLKKSVDCHAHLLGDGRTFYFP